MNKIASLEDEFIALLEEQSKEAAQAGLTENAALSTCPPFRLWLEAYGAEPIPEVRKFVEEHIPTCERCSADAEMLRGLAVLEDELVSSIVPAVQKPVRSPVKAFQTFERLVGEIHAIAEQVVGRSEPVVYLEQSDFACSMVQLSRDPASGDYAKFVMGPLEPSLEPLFTDALRRMLLSSTPGAGITSLRIGGVKDEFSLLAGSNEDVIDIILNLKKMAVRSSGSGTLELRVKGPCRVTAADLRPSPGVEIVNPGTYICTLTNDVPFEMAMEVEKGVGFRPASKNAKVDRLPGTIFLDTQFSPVNRVVCRSEKGRLQSEKRATLEVWTNGSLLPAEALKQSVTMLEELRERFPNVGIEDIPALVTNTEGGDGKVFGETIDVRLEDLEFSVRSRNLLEQENIRTLGELAKKRVSDLLAIKNFDKKSLSEVRLKLAQHGAALRIGGTKTQIR